jgi:hypothetical protein
MPGDVFTSIPFDEPEKDMIESLTPGTINTAGHYLDDMCNVTPIPFSFKISSGTKE